MYKEKNQQILVGFQIFN